jgi:hypothetical protein
MSIPSAELKSKPSMQQAAAKLCLHFNHTEEDKNFLRKAN